jgi:single-strand DNA-binding protein
MASLNKVMLIGNLGKDPEIRTTPGGHSVCTISMATNREYTKGDEKVKETEWHRVVIWGKQAEAVAKYMEKGRSMFVEGRLQTRSWEDKDGITRYVTEIVAERVQFLGGNGGTKGPDRQPGYTPPGMDDASGPVDDDSIPF